MAKTKEQKRADNKEYYKKNREREKAKARTYYENNKSECLARVADYYYANHTECRDRQRRYYLSRRYIENNPFSVSKHITKKMIYDFKTGVHRLKRTLNRIGPDRVTQRSPF